MSGSLFKICPRACGDFAVQRFSGGRIIRFGVCETRAEARGMLRIANAGLREICK